MFHPALLLLSGGVFFAGVLTGNSVRKKKENTPLKFKDIKDITKKSAVEIQNSLKTEIPEEIKQQLKKDMLKGLKAI